MRVKQGEDVMMSSHPASTGGSTRRKKRAIDWKALMEDTLGKDSTARRKMRSQTEVTNQTSSVRKKRVDCEGAVGSRERCATLCCERLRQSQMAARRAGWKTRVRFIKISK